VPAARAGHLGLPMMLGYIGGTLAHARGAIDIYRTAGDAAGHDPKTLQVRISTHFYAAASEQDATEVFEYYRTYLHPDANNGRGFVVDRAMFDTARRRDGALTIGTPEQLTEKSSTPKPSSASPASSASSTGADSRPRACTSRSRA
jgi:alkanesulfonate monooxygenase SsuD/methylene tetrahydromethanopterin reductase-like flavin-dependent oxidoreductase (luciferase family)